jgi:hypothetical protein
MRPFPTASHNYFRVMNLDKAKKDFLAAINTANPIFEYPNYLKTSIIDNRIKVLKSEQLKDTNLLRVFDLIRLSADLQSFVSDDAIKKFKAINTEIYGTPRVDYVFAILNRIHANVTPINQKYWDEVVNLLHIDSTLNKTYDIWPDNDLFSMIKSYGDKYMHELLIENEETELPKIIKNVLKKVGLEKNGWKLKLLNDSSSARVDHHRKTILIGSKYKTRTNKSKYRIAAHEVYGHSMRGEGLGLKESEGFAILLEQLCDEKFKPRRSLRYLSAALAWGVIGEPLDFRETFEIIWKLMVIWAQYDVESAKSHAFDECVRVFRGGLPNIPGVIYLKDITYFSANIEIWDWLKKVNISYNDFKDITTGKRRILS